MDKVDQFNDVCEELNSLADITIRLNKLNTPNEILERLDHIEYLLLQFANQLEESL